MEFRYIDAKLAGGIKEAGREYEEALAQHRKRNHAFAVVIIGQQNNGKSTLCNALVRDWQNRKFPVADRRLTSSTQEEYDSESGILYVDTPGFSSATGSDDMTAQAEWTRANLLIFVHSLRVGELNADEVHVLQRLKATVPDLDRRLFMACSKALEEDEDLAMQERKLETIREQIRQHVGMDVAMEAIDSLYYQMGMAEDDAMLVASTNVPRLLGWIEARRGMPSSLDAVLEQRCEAYGILLRQARDVLQADREDFDRRRRQSEKKMIDVWTTHREKLRNAWNRCRKYVR